MSPDAGRIVLAALASVTLQACPRTPPATAYDLPVVTSGGIEEPEGPRPVPLALSVEIVDAPDGTDLASAVETAVAFGYHAELGGCQSTSGGWTVAFEKGTLVIAFTLEPGGTVRDPSLLLATGDPPEAFTACLVGVVGGMIIDGAVVEEPVGVHLTLRYGEEASLPPPPPPPSAED